MSFIDKIAGEAAEAARKAVLEAAVRQEAQEALEAAKNAKAREKRSKGGWSEHYDVTTKRYTTIYGRDAIVRSSNTQVSYRVYQNANDRTEWMVRKDWYDETAVFAHKDEVLWELRSNDFEATIKACVLLILAEQGLSL